MNRNIFSGLNLRIRIPFTLLIVFLGFIFPLFFLLAIFSAWTIINDIREAPKRNREEVELTKIINAPRSITDVRDLCESPAEEMFLSAMVKAFDLKTGLGAIEGNGLRLRNQVELGRFYGTCSQYRVDFLIDDHLIVEIDGEAYHSSPKAIERDKKRDDDLKKEGYSILRIPAQIVFQKTEEAVQLVQSARLR